MDSKYLRTIIPKKIYELNIWNRRLFVTAILVSFLFNFPDYNGLQWFHFPPMEEAIKRLCNQL